LIGFAMQNMNAYYSTVNKPHTTVTSYNETTFLLENNP